MKEKVKKVFYFILKVLFLLSIPGFLYLILDDKQYGGGAVIFVFSIWGLIEYTKWVNRTFNIISTKEEETLGDKIQKEFEHLNPKQEEYLNSYFKNGLIKTDEEIINELRKLTEKQK